MSNNIADSLLAQSIHELRNVLTRLRFDEQKTKNDVIEEISGFLKKLDAYSRAEAGVIFKTDISVSGLITSILNNFNDEKSRINVSLGKNFTVKADKELLEVMFCELIDNAIKHSTGKIKITLTSTGKNSALFSVSNISQFDDKLLEPAMSKHVAYATNKDLGLATSSLIASAHGYGFTVSNQQESAVVSVALNFL